MEQIVSMGSSQLALDGALNARIANVTVNDGDPVQELKVNRHNHLYCVFTYCFDKKYLFESRKARQHILPHTCTSSSGYNIACMVLVP